MQYSSCDLLAIIGGLQIFELKLAMDDHELTKVYSLMIYFIWVHISWLNWKYMHMLLAMRCLNGLKA